MSVPLRGFAAAVGLFTLPALVGCSGDSGGTPPEPTADVQVTVIGDTSPEAGEVVEYTVRVLNLGPDPALGVAARASLPGDWELVSATDQGAATGGSVVWPEVPTLEIGASLTLRVSLRPGTAGVRTLRASSTATTPDPDPSNNDGSSETGALVVEVQEPLRADVTVALDAPLSVLPGQLFTYDVTVTNQGPGAARGVVAILELASDQVVPELPPGASLEDGAVTFATIADIEVGAEVVLPVNAVAPPVGPLEAVARAESSSNDPMPSNNNGSLEDARTTSLPGFTTLWSFAPGDADEWVGRSLARLGDLDGDGAMDLAVGATDGSEPFGGRVYVVSGRTGALLYRTEAPEAPSSFGASVAPLADQDGDGIGDLVVGAPSVTRDGFRVGAAYALSGADGRILRTFLGDPGIDGRFGGGVAGLGDVDGDAVPDLVVGVSDGPSGEGTKGRADILSAVDGRVIRSVSGPTNVRFGAEVGAVGDLDGDGEDDFTVRAALENGDGLGTLRAFSARSGQLLYTIDHDATGEAFGAIRVETPGDLDGDGVPDLFALDEFNSARGQWTGRAYVFSGIDGSPLHVWTGEGEGQFFGPGGRAGDVDDDGVGDVIVTAAGNSEGDPGLGKAYIFSGRDGRLVRTLTSTREAFGFGRDALGVGDVNGDGHPDFLVVGSRLEADGIDVLELVAGVPLS